MVYTPKQKQPSPHKGGIMPKKNMTASIYLRLKFSFCLLRTSETSADVTYLYWLGNKKTNCVLFWKSVPRVTRWLIPCRSMAGLEGQGDGSQLGCRSHVTASLQRAALCFVVGHVYCTLSYCLLHRWGRRPHTRRNRSPLSESSCVCVCVCLAVVYTKREESLDCGWCLFKYCLLHKHLCVLLRWHFTRICICYETDSVIFLTRQYGKNDD